MRNLQGFPMLWSTWVSLCASWAWLGFSRAFLESVQLIKLNMSTPHISRHCPPLSEHISQPVTKYSVVCVII